ncbi:MAG TPA: response regulator, partial [Planctomycetota bacterium]|nr:response regulator [Planctomycetota bacterium]
GGHLETITTSTQGTIWEITVPGAPPQAQTLPAATAQRSKSGSRLPQIQPQAAPIPVQDAVASRPHGKILLADDEENFRLFTSWALRERGFEVITAQDGQEAFERFQEAPEEFALVILDAYMPRMGGLEAYLRMQVLRSDLPVLFASGFARGPSIDALVSGCPGPADVLLKPFSSEDLLEAVKKALRPRT